MSREGIRPTTPDEDVLESINRISADRVTSVMNQQQELQDSIANQEHTDEQIFYGQLRSTMRQQEKLVDDFEAYVKRTSNYDNLCNAKREQMQSIEASRGSAVNYIKQKTFHKTAIEGDLNTTVFSGKRVNADHLSRHDQENKVPQMLTTATSSRREAHFSAD